MTNMVGKRVEVWLDVRRLPEGAPLAGVIVSDNDNFPSDVRIRLDDGRCVSDHECWFSLSSAEPGDSHANHP